MATRKTTENPTPTRRRITFRVEAAPDSDVRLVGEFNGWNPETLRMARKGGNGTHEATLLLPAGRYEYKFVVNGEWQCDPACPNWIPNGHGTLNSVIEVR
jgi:1,4-alpha-glucan branching enzyme